MLRRTVELFSVSFETFNAFLGLISEARLSDTPGVHQKRLQSVKRSRARQNSVTGERSSATGDSAERAVESEAQEQLVKLRATTSELEQENLALREEIKKLREEEKPHPNLELRENVYWLMTDSERTGPFCPRCYSEHQRLARLLDGARFVAKTRWICPVCNHVFDSET